MPTATFEITDTLWDQTVQRQVVGAVGSYTSGIDTGTLSGASGAVVQSPARSRTGTTPSFTFTIRNLLLRWDTSSLDDAANLTAARLIPWVNNVNNVDGLSLAADWFAWTGGGTAGDWSHSPGTSALAEVALSTFADGGVATGKGPLVG